MEPGAQKLLNASHALMQSLFPAESNHYYSAEKLRSPNVDFFVAELGTTVVGCCALARFDGYGEIKSMFVDPGFRGRGVGRALINHIETHASGCGYGLLRLETGYLLETAHKLYASKGFELTGPFGDYPDDPNSVFMEKAL